MKCLKCGHAWKRTKFTEMISFASTCPNCGSRWLLKGIFGGDLNWLKIWERKKEAKERIKK